MACVKLVVFLAIFKDDNFVEKGFCNGRYSVLGALLSLASIVSTVCSLALAVLVYYMATGRRSSAPTGVANLDAHLPSAGDGNAAVLVSSGTDGPCRFGVSRTMASAPAVIDAFGSGRRRRARLRRVRRRAFLLRQLIGQWRGQRHYEERWLHR